MLVSDGRGDQNYLIEMFGLLSLHQLSSFFFFFYQVFFLAYEEVELNSSISVDGQSFK